MQKKKDEIGSLSVELESLSVQDDLPHATNGGNHRQTHSNHDAELIVKHKRNVLSTDYISHQAK